MKTGVTFIISARNEAKTIPFTITNLMLDCWQSGIDYEFIIADNGSEDDTTRFFTHILTNGYSRNATTQFPRELAYSSRGLVTDGKLRFCYDPVYSNVGARHNAVKYARYPNIIFADAHISVKPNTVKYMLETLDQFGGIVHVPVAWMGASVERPKAGVQYTYKIGEKIWGTWNYAMVKEDKPFFIPVSGHCFIAIKKAQYLDFGGYDTNQQIYGGGENYLDSLYWMLGSNVMVDPRGLCFHLSAGRGYSYNMDSLIHNMMLTAYTLGGQKWSERILITYLNKGDDPHKLITMHEQAIREGKPKRDMISERQIMTLEEMLALNKTNDCDGSCRGASYAGVSNHARRVWDIKNDALHGNHHSFVVVFDDWLTRLTNPLALEYFKNSPFQQ
jgi:glycosyltransferase involved in cell wall biosynthesis